jgi:hypothetical protein
VRCCCAVNDTGLGVQIFANSSLGRPSEQAGLRRVLPNHAHTSGCVDGFTCGKDRTVLPSRYCVVRVILEAAAGDLRT